MKSSELIEGAVYKVGGYSHAGYHVFTGRFHEKTEDRWSKGRLVPRTTRVPLFQQMTDREPSEGTREWYVSEGFTAPKLGDVSEQARRIRPQEIEYIYASSVDAAVRMLEAARLDSINRAEKIALGAERLESVTGRTWGTSYRAGTVTYTLSVGYPEVETFVAEMKERQK